MQYVLNGFNGTKITDYASAVKGLSLNQAQLLLSTQKLNAEESKSILIDAGLMASKDRISLSLAKEALAQTTLNDEEQESILIKLGLIADEAGEAATQEFCTQKDIEALVAQGLLNEEQKEGILAVLGLDSANKSASVSIGLFTKGILANIKAMLAWMVSNPFGQIMLGAGLLMGAVGIIDLLTTSVEEHREQLSGLKSEYSEIKSELDGVNSELESTQNKIKDLESKGTLTFTEAEELENLRKQNNELKRQNDLLEMQEKIKAKEVNDKFVETMEADAGKIEYASGNTKRTETRGGYTYEVNVTDITEKEHAFKQIEELSKLYAEKEKATTEEQIKAIDQRIETVNKYLQDKNKEWLEDAEGIDYIQNPTTEDDKKVNEWLDYINNFQDKMAIAMGGDNAKENAFNRLVDNWKFDEALNPLQKLGKEGKVTLDELKKRMDDPVFVEFVNKLKDIGFISDTTDGSLRFLASAFNGTTISAKAYLDSLDDNESLSNFINNLDDEAKALGTTKDELSKLTAGHIILNNTKLSLDDKINQIKQLGIMAGWAEGKVEELVVLMNRAAGNLPDSMTQAEKDARSGSAQLALYNFFGGWKQVDTDVDNDTPPYSPSGDDKGSSKDNTPDYEDPTDAIINRINLRSKEIEKQEEEIQNLIEIAELENDYKKQISLTNDLIANRKKRVEELQTANAGLHQMAEDFRNSTPQWNEDSWFDSQGNATEAYYSLYNSSSKEEQEKIKDQFEKISKIKKAWVDNDEELVSINKELLQDAEKLNELYDELANSKIGDIKHQIELNINNSNEDFDSRAYYKQIQDIAHAEAERLRALDPEKYKEQIQEWQNVWWDAQHNIEDWLNDIFSKVTDFGSSYWDSRKALLQSYYDVTNSISEAQHEINKELRASKTMYEYLDEDTRKLLFNQEDYNTLSEELYDIQYKADKLQRQYQYDLENATLNTIEEITSNYEMQYETLMKSYEIAKAELEVAKKRQQLDNVLNERNVSMFINGQWQWVANTQDVINAQSELADAEWARKTAEAGANQTEAMNALTQKTNLLTTTINKFESGVITLDEAMQDVCELFGQRLPAYIEKSFTSINKSSSNGHVSLGSSMYNSKRDETYVKTNEGQFLIIKGKESYSQGTKNAKKGLADVNEILPEGLMTQDGRFIPMANLGGGEMIFNHQMMENLWNQARTPWNVPQFNLPNLVNKSQSIDQRQDNRIIINGMTVDSGSSEGQTLISALRRYVNNH